MNKNDRLFEINSWTVGTKYKGIIHNVTLYDLGRFFFSSLYIDQTAKACSVLIDVYNESQYEYMRELIKFYLKKLLCRIKL